MCNTTFIRVLSQTSVLKLKIFLFNHGGIIFSSTEKEMKKSENYDFKSHNTN